MIFSFCANITELTFINLDDIAYYTSRLYDIDIASGVLVPHTACYCTKQYDIKSQEEKMPSGDSKHKMYEVAASGT